MVIGEGLPRRPAAGARGASVDPALTRVVRGWRLDWQQQTGACADRHPMQTTLNTSLPLLKAGAAAPLADSLKTLRPGQTLEAQLVALDSDGGGDLRLADGTVLRATLPGALALGSRLLLRVEAGQPNAPLLKLLAVELPPSGAPGAARTATAPPLPQPAPPTMAMPGPLVPAGAEGRSGRIRAGAPLLDLAAGNDKGATAPAAGDTRALSSALTAYADAGRDLSGPQHQPAGGHAAADDPGLRFTVAMAGLERPVEVQVERDPDEERDTETRRAGWQLRFSVESAATGPTEARLRFHAGRLDLALWAERPELAAALAERLDELRADLAAADVAAGSLSVHRGRPGASLGRHGVVIGD